MIKQRFITTKTDDASLTLLEMGEIIVNKATAITITVLVATGYVGLWYRIINIGAGDCTVTISGGSNITTLAQDESILIMSDGTNWIKALSSGSGVSAHNDLSDIQGGDTDDYYHFTQTQHTDLTDAGDCTLHYHSTDRDRAVHTGTQPASTISDFDTEVSNNTDVLANTTARHTRLHSIISASDHLAATPTDYGKYVRANPTTGEIEFTSVAPGGGAVDSVNGQTGVVVLDATDVGADVTGAATGEISTHESAYDHTKLHDRDHDINSTSDHNGIVSATPNNFMGIDINGLPKDSGSKASDFATAGHNHDGVYEPDGIVSIHEGKEVTDIDGIHGFKTATPSISTDGKYLKWDNAQSKHVYDALTGSGDMMKIDYDTNDDGVVDAADIATTAESAEQINRIPVPSPVAGDDGKVLVYDHDTGAYILDSLAASVNAADVPIADTEGNFTATDVEGALSELFTSVSDFKTGIAAAITDMGVATSGSDNSTTMEANIRAISAGSISPTISLGQFDLTGDYTLIPSIPTYVLSEVVP